jgi:hypothetical protein
MIFSQTRWSVDPAVALALGDLQLAGWIFARTHRRALATGRSRATAQ